MLQNSAVTIDASNNVYVPGNVTVGGTTTTINSTTLDVADSNITVNKGGNDASSTGAGLTVDRTSTKGSLVFDATKATKFKLGLLGSEVEVVDISSAQTLSAKTITHPDGTVLAPSISFDSDTNTGMYRLASDSLGLTAGGVLGMNMVNIGSSLLNFGFGAAADGTAANPFIFSRSLNGDVYNQWSNPSTGAGASNNFFVSTGVTSGEYLNFASFGNTYTPNSNLAQQGLVQTGVNMLGLTFNSLYTGAKMAWSFDTPTAAHEVMSLSSTALTLKKGTTLNANGSTSGTITFQPQAAAGTYNWNWPTTAGSSGQVLTSAGGGATAMTWSSPATNPMTAGGSLIVGGAAGAATELLNGTAGQVLTSAGGTSPPTWVTRTPTRTYLTSLGAVTGTIFTITSGNATKGATYTNNGNTFTVLSTVTSSTTLYTSKTGNPAASGTLTKASGTGDATLTFSAFNNTAVYTPPANCVALQVTAIGAGGGGGSTAGSTNAGGAAGGGAGGVSIKRFTTIDTGYNYIVGAGGTGALAGGTTGTTGQVAQFREMSSASGSGGVGCTANANVAVFNTGYTGGGTNSGGDLGWNGYEGAPGMTLSASQARGGTGGNSVFGNGGFGGQGTQGGSNAGGYGAGGGGGCSVSAGAGQKGGDGSGSIIIIDEYY